VARPECSGAERWSWQLRDRRPSLHQPKLRAHHAHHFTPLRSGSCHPLRSSLFKPRRDSVKSDIRWLCIQRPTSGTVASLCGPAISQRSRPIHTASSPFHLAPGDPPGAKATFDFPIQNGRPLKL